MVSQHIESKPLGPRRERSRQAILDAAMRGDRAPMSALALRAAADLSRTTFLSHFADVPDLAAFIVLRACDLGELDAADFARDGHLQASATSALLPYQRLFASVTGHGCAEVAARLRQRLRARHQLTRARVEGALQIIRRIAAQEVPSAA